MRFADETMSDLNSWAALNGPHILENGLIHDCAAEP